MLVSGVCVSSSNIRISTRFVISNDASSGTVDRKSCTTVSCRTCGPTGRTQGIPAGGVNGSRATLGFKLGGRIPKNVKMMRVKMKMCFGW